MSNQPKLNLTTADRVIEVVGLICLIQIWIFTLSNYYSLPETIPIHYNGAGEVDRIGEKWNILALPIVSSILFMGLTILN